MSTRRLAAIMFTDIVGYTAMMQENEAHAVSVRQRHREVFERLHEQYQGTILQYYGDGTLSIFDSAVAATQCAIDMQLAFQEEPPVPLRIGIHTG
ncbi:MAG: adenylate/guanylate cyclase domain-containing protein, partial [Bacteroidota bacterium]